MKCDKGLTLIELVVAMLILSLFAIAYASSTTTSFKTYFSAGKKTIALNYAKDIVENIKNSPTKSETSISNAALSTAGYTYSLSVSRVKGSLYSVNVSVYYPYPKSVDLFTLVY